MTTTRASAPTATWRNRITGSGEEAHDQVLVNRRSGFVVDGHARVALALSRGEPADGPVDGRGREAQQGGDPIGSVARREAEAGDLGWLLIPSQEPRVDRSRLTLPMRGPDNGGEGE